MLSAALCLMLCSQDMPIGTEIYSYSCSGEGSTVLTSGGSRWDNGAVKASLGDNVDLDGRVTARVVDGTRVNLGNSHVVCYLLVRWSEQGRARYKAIGKRSQRGRSQWCLYMWKARASDVRRQGPWLQVKKKQMLLDKPTASARPSEFRWRATHWGSNTVRGMCGSAADEAIRMWFDLRAKSDSQIRGCQLRVWVEKKSCWSNENG